MNRAKNIQCHFCALVHEILELIYNYIFEIREVISKEFIVKQFDSTVIIEIGKARLNIGDIDKSFVALKQALSHDVAAVKLLRGAEIAASPMRPMLSGLGNDMLKRLSINASRYLLIEMPALHIPPYMEDLIYNIQLKGFIPIIAHPERNKDVADNPPAAYELVEQGALLQLNAGSVVGHFGKDVQKTSLLLLKHGLAHFIATDAHSPRKRAPRMMESFGFIADRFGYEQAGRLWVDNPTAVISDDFISAGHITSFRKRIFGGWK
ncbi:tyrosine-protein phosphatase [Mahella australiensis]|uniref:protein-tyrosine-phosphatase n=1 Tax=Mahella australiensis (strain DSM 15567 / CIP 107919 / 50-1 BON) TaxID=697281 RepID=F3ZXA7_MAHA5|nr:CpsB/CapC family capsule biosynthesis tyrosine phosphatase [Mahella australiensis]AEE96564.1 Protein-tyrosine-phosphatase [Mahella australiensis 50-1 BON]